MSPYGKDPGEELYKYSIAETGLLVREKEFACEVFIGGEWISPETSFGYQMPISIQEVHFLILKALKDRYHSDPVYKNRTLPRC